MSHARMFGNVWSHDTGHSLEKWMGSDAVGAVLSRPTGQALEERVSTGHSLEEWVGGDAADAVLSRPTCQALKKRVGGDAP